MKASIKKLFVLTLISIMILSTNSCKKYEDGPLFSLRSKTARLVGKWKIVEGIEDDYDVYLIFEKDKDFTMEVEYAGSTYDFDGEWEWGDKKESVIIDYDNGEEVEFEILRLTNKDFWFRDEDDEEYKAKKQ